MPRPDPWLKYLNPAGPSGAPHAPHAPQLVCFPHSGGAASVYRPLGLELAGDAEVVAVQYPGRQDRHDEPVVTDLHELADRAATALRAAPTEVPRIFFGHSMGAILAYEVAQRLGPEGPVALIASGRPAPSRVRLTTSYLLDDEALAHQVVWLGGTAAELLEHPEMRSLLLPLIRGDYRASETYRPRGDAPLSCALVALGGDVDPVAPLDDLRAWAGHTTGPFRLETLSGDHFYLQHNWPEVAALVRSLALATECREAVN
ncbi:alpha/beta fold hydrolase [Streptomyces xanthophaeus]|uniref:thioesterase II family protein n=1 Tax=Streptomyces xanthophaeus TaxID=67385 RepID=UPI003866E679|nr:alpha/beta fold hydrolase [Streptomyces xanthophaeus]WST61975.1 alpha/beta fold hydrolase [Streptomyces xanthophaeus]